MLRGSGAKTPGLGSQFLGVIWVGSAGTFSRVTTRLGEKPLGQFLLGWAAASRCQK